MKKEKGKRNTIGNDQDPDRLGDDKVRTKLILESQHNETNNVEEYEHVKKRRNKKRTSESVLYDQENNNTYIESFQGESKHEIGKKTQRSSDNEQNQERVNNDKSNSHRSELECQHNRINNVGGELSIKKKKKRKTSRNKFSGQGNNIDIIYQERVVNDKVEGHTRISEDEHHKFTNVVEYENVEKRKKKKKTSENVYYDQDNNIDGLNTANFNSENKHFKKEKRKTSEQNQQRVEVESNKLEDYEHVKKQKKNKKILENTLYDQENNIDNTHLEYFLEGNEKVKNKKMKPKTLANDQDQIKINNAISESLTSILEDVNELHHVEKDEHVKKRKKKKKTSDNTHHVQYNYNTDKTLFEYSIGEDEPIKKHKKKRKTSDEDQSQETEIYGTNSEHFIEDVQYKKSKKRKRTSEEHSAETNITDNISYDEAKFITGEISGTLELKKKIKKKEMKTSMKTSTCVVPDNTLVSDNSILDIKDYNKNRCNRKEVTSEPLPKEQLFTSGPTDLDKIFGNTSSQGANNLSDKINKLLKRNDVSVKNNIIDESSGHNINNHYSKHISSLCNDNSEYEDKKLRGEMMETDELTSCKKKTKDNAVEDSLEINSIYEVEDELYNYDRENEKEKVQSLEIESPWTLHLIHTIANRVSTPPTPEQRRALDASGIQLKLGKYTKEEDEKIMKNWRTFCKLHQWDENYYQPFVNGSKRSRSGSLTTEQFRKFVQFISHGFEDRLMYNIYLRFQRLFLPETCKIRKFTPEEDKLILKYVESAKSDSPFADLAMTLKRSRLAIYKHYQWLISESPPVEIKWDKELTEKLLDNILTVTQSSDIPDLKDHQISKSEWQKISENMSIPIEKLKRAWLHHFYPRFVFPLYTEYLAEAKEKLVNIVYNKYKDWREIDWYDMEREMKNGMNHTKLSKLLKNLVRHKVPENKKYDFRESLEHLKQELDDIKSKTCNKMSYVEDIVRDRELRRMLEEKGES